MQPYQKRRRMSSTEERILAHAVAAGIDLPSIKARALAPCLMPGRTLRFVSVGMCWLTVHGPCAEQLHGSGRFRQPHLCGLLL